MLNDFLNLVLWRLTLARCTDVGEFLRFEFLVFGGSKITLRN